jgi:hypothetical protein
MIKSMAFFFKELERIAPDKVKPAAYCAGFDNFITIKINEHKGFGEHPDKLFFEVNRVILPIDDYFECGGTDYQKRLARTYRIAKKYGFAIHESKVIFYVESPNDD